VFGIASVGGDVFSRHSYDNDGHEKAIASIELCTFDATDLTLLRLDIVCLMCGVTKNFILSEMLQIPNNSANIVISFARVHVATMVVYFYQE